MAASEEHIQKVTGARQIHTILEKLQDERARLTLRPSNADGQGFDVLFLELDTRRQAIITDSLVGQAADLLARADSMRVETRLEGIRLWWEAPRWLKIHEEGDVYYGIPLPKSLFRLQRRAYFRVEVPPTTEGRCLIHAAQGSEPIEGEIRDISLGGVSMKVPASVAERIETDQLISRLKLSGEVELELEASLEVCNIRKDDDTGEVIFGARFRELKERESDLLARAVNLLQMMGLKRG